MTSEWPFAWRLGGGQAGWDRSMEPEYDDAEPHSVPYIHRDAARAWQAFRDFLNGTPEQWHYKCVWSYDRGYADGYDDLDARIRG